MLVGISEAICVLIIFIQDPTFESSLKGYAAPLRGAWWPSARLRRPKGHLAVQPLRSPLRGPAKQDFNNPNKFKEWLAGLIDGDGCFLLSKKGYASLEITMDIRDKKALFLIKQEYGGSVKQRSGAKAKRYRQHHKIGQLKLIEDKNGRIRNPIRQQQLSSLCEKYNRGPRGGASPLIFPCCLKYYTGWFSGFFDADGSIYLSPDGIIISAVNNVKGLLDDLENQYGGKIYVTNKTGRSFKWQITRKEDIQNLKNNYFHVCPSNSAKFNRIRLIDDYFALRKIKAHLATPESINGKLWIRFLNKWDTWEGGR